MKPRVLHLLSQRPGWTGSGVALDAIVRAADHAGWDQCAVVGTSTDDATPKVGELDSTQIRPLVFERDPLTFRLPGMSDVMPYPSTVFSQMSSEQLTNYRASWKRHIANVVDDFRPDVIHSHHIWLLSAMVKDVAPQIPVATHCHGTGIRQLARCSHLADEVRVGCSRNEAFFALHQENAKELQEILGVAEDRINVIGSGFRSDLFHDRGRSENCGPVVTYAGKLCNAKGVPWLLQAADRLAERIPGLEFHVAGAGTGPEAEAIRKQMEVMPCIRFHGQIDQPRLADLFRQSAVFVLPSFFEGLPLVLVEAAACGCRLVATALPGIVDDLKNDLGGCLELVPLPRLQSVDRPEPADLPAFVDALANAIEQSLGRPKLENVGDIVAKMSWGALFGRIETVWKRLKAE